MVLVSMMMHDHHVIRLGLGMHCMDTLEPITGTMSHYSGGMYGVVHCCLMIASHSLPLLLLIHHLLLEFLMLILTLVHILRRWLLMARVLQPVVINFPLSRNRPMIVLSLNQLIITQHLVRYCNFTLTLFGKVVILPIPLNIKHRLLLLMLELDHSCILGQTLPHHLLAQVTTHRYLRLLNNSLLVDLLTACIGPISFKSLILGSVAKVDHT